MNNEHPENTREALPDSRLLEELIRTAGRRPAPPEAAYLRSLALATDTWRAKTTRLRRRRQLIALASSVAAVAVVVVVLWSFLPRPGTPAAPVATLERVIGRLEVRLPEASSWQPAPNDTANLVAGSRLRTGPGSRTGVRLGNGSSLRLDESTEVALEGPAHLALVAGRAYVDSGSDIATVEPVEIVTTQATAREVGTQFEVALLGDTYRLRVREGSVVLRHDGESTTGAAGEQLLIRANRDLERAFILRADASWQWVETVAPAPDLNGRPVAQLLDWVARETGRAIRYADHDVERRASTTILHGSIRDLAPLEALKVMLATTHFEYTMLPDGTLLIQARPPD